MSLTYDRTSTSRIIISLFIICLINNFLPTKSLADISSAETNIATQESQLINKANQAYWTRNFSCAKNACEELLNLESLKIPRARILTNMAICDAQLDNWDLAEKEAKKGLDITCNDDTLTQSDALLVIGRCLIVAKKTTAAQDKYCQSLSLAIKKLGDWNCDLATIYEGLAACAYTNNDLQTANKLYKKVVQLDCLKYGPDSTQVAWGLLSLCNVLSAMNQNDQAHILYKKVFWNFRHQNELRIISEASPEDKNKPAFIAELRKQLYGFNNGYNNRNQGSDYIKQDIPSNILSNPHSRSTDFNNWFFDGVGRDTAPGLAFFDPKTQLKALIITIHGLGLHQGAFTPFAEKVQHSGFGVISFDVRGFGSYRNDEIYQRMDFKAVISDLQRILTELRYDYPGLPMFVLGESMGGAIALRLAAVSPELIDGVVSSVPAGTRFHAKSTTLEVAVKFLKNSHEQFNIGQRVVNQATKNEDVRTAWEDDPRARMNFSADDLIEFQKFMNENMTYAEKIEKTPVIIYQGYSDELVKPLGTLALYQAIKSKDKDLIFIGHAEHLIFEEGQFDQEIVNGLLSWLDLHVATRQSPSVAACKNLTH